MGLFGGGNSSSSSTSNTQNFDDRQVNTVTTDSHNYDLSDNSVKVTNSAYDLSDHSTTTSSDNSFTQTITNLLDGGAINGIGDIAAAAIKSGQAGTLAGYNYSDGVFDAAMTYANGVNDHQADAYKAAAAMTSDALTGARAAYQSASNQVSSALTGANAQIASAYGAAGDMAMAALKAVVGSGQAAQVATADAYADAKGTTNSQKQIVIGVLVVAGIMALAMLQKKA
jgi:hypothetical protein